MKLYGMPTMPRRLRSSEASQERHGTMKRVFISISLILMCLLASCSMAGNDPDDTDNPGLDQPTNPAEPETPAGPEEPEQAPLSRPYISFIDFVNPGLSTAAVTMSTSESNAEIYYTTDGSTPSEDNGTEYNWNKRTLHCGSLICKGVPVSSGCTVKAVTFKDDRYSEVVSFQVPSEPTLDPPTIFIRGEDGDLVVISMQTNDSAATIYFTRDGSTPTAESMIYENQKTTHVLPGNLIVSGTIAGHGDTVKAFAHSTRYGLTSDITTLYID